MNVIIFDDKKVENFYPLTLNRIFGDLRCGAVKNRQRISAYLNTENENYLMPESLTDLYKKRHSEWQINDFETGEYIFVNSRLLINEEIANQIKDISENCKLTHKNEIVATKINLKKSSLTYHDFEELIEEFSVKEIDNVEMFEHTWDIIGKIDKLINADFHDFFYEEENAVDTEMGVTVLNPYNLWIGLEVNIQPGVILDASQGPIIIDEGAEIMANSVIVGPAYIGKRSKIKIGAKIYEGTSIGPVCKIGGEVEESIFQAYSNKQHDGFLGHSFIGEWVNIGADTNNSDLKNNYKNVKMYHYPDKGKIDTGSQFVGCVIGDHTKTGINVSINTGTVIGMGSNIFGRELFKNFINDFSWGTADAISIYHLQKFLETAEKVKNRRGMKLLSEEKVLYNKLFQKRV